MANLRVVKEEATNVTEEVVEIVTQADMNKISTAGRELTFRVVAEDGGKAATLHYVMEREVPLPDFILNMMSEKPKSTVSFVSVTVRIRWWHRLFRKDLKDLVVAKKPKLHRMAIRMLDGIREECRIQADLNKSK